MNDWVVMLDPNAERPGLFDTTPKLVGEEASRRSAQVVVAHNSTEAAEAYTCSVWDLSVGLPLLVFKVEGDPRRFHREYTNKGGNDFGGPWPSNPVTLER